MPTKCLLIVASSFALLFSTPAHSQNDSAAAATPTAPPNPQIQAALANLTLESNALHTMLHSIGNMRVNSQDRINAMNAYMKSKNLLDGWQTYSSSTKNVPAGTSFNQGYQTALSNEKLLGMPQPTTQDLDALTNDVAATTTLAQESWNAQNKLFQQVAVLSSYLQSKNELIGYQQWAPNYAAQQRSAQSERYAAANQQADQQTAAYYQHLDALHQQWDQQPHGTGLDFNYGFSQGNGPDEGGSGESAINSGVGVNAPNVQGVNTPWSYAGNQGGFYMGGLGYYNGSNYNSYSDTYPDLYGYPAGTNMGVNGYNTRGINNAWNRTNPRENPRTPNGVGGAGGARGVGQVGGVGGAGQVGGAGGVGQVGGARGAGGAGGVGKVGEKR